MQAVFDAMMTSTVRGPWQRETSLPNTQSAMRHVSLATDQSLTFHVPLASLATAWHFNVRRFGCHSDIAVVLINKKYLQTLLKFQRST